MTAAFFHGVLGQFSPYSAMGGGGAVPAGPGGSYVPPRPSDPTGQQSDNVNSNQGARIAGGENNTNIGQSGFMGAANRPRQDPAV